MNDLIERIYSFAKEQHIHDNSGHDFGHIKRVYDMSLELAKDYPEANIVILQVSALLHDVDDYKLVGGLETDRTGAFLESMNFSKDDIENIKSVIHNSSYSNNFGRKSEELSIETQILSDADKLDAIGAEGIIRTFIYGNSVKQPIFLPACLPRKNLSREAYRSDTRSDAHCIVHFFDKLLKLKSMMYTNKAKVIAQKRHELMICFLEEFFGEENAPAVWYDLLDMYKD